MLFFQRNRKKQSDDQTSNKDPEHRGMISPNLLNNLAVLQSIFIDTPELVVRHLVIKQTQDQAALIYLSGITDVKTIFTHVLEPLLFEVSEKSSQAGVEVSLGHIKETSSWTEIESAILEGNCILLIDTRAAAFVYDTPEFPKRPIEDTPIESSLKGAHVGFTETSRDNVALIRKQIHNRELKVKEMTVGERGKTKLHILYLADVANPAILKDLEERIQHLKVDSIMNAGQLIEYIEDHPNSPFPQLLLTERPDFAAQEILQGSFTVVVDRSPNVIIGPVAFDTFFKTTDDYSSHWMIASFNRFIRYLGFFMAIFLPAFYIATISFHVDIIPLKLLIFIGESRERIPFPPFIEALIMEITLEMLREAGIRLPAKIGQTVGIVGGIVIGQAAVAAGIVSNIMVIVVALTAIASFIIPNYEMSSAIRIVRFPMMILATMFGFVGIVVGFMILTAHFISLESLGAPYGSPVAPLRFADWKDTVIRIPQWAMQKRPFHTSAIQNKKGDEQ